MCCDRDPRDDEAEAARWYAEMAARDYLFDLVPPVVPCRAHELPHVAEKQAQKMLGVPAWR
jgi:hypothetical protein